MPNPQQMQMPDMSKILKIAQEVASKIEPPPELNNGKEMTEEDMTRAMEKITKSVGSIVNNDMIGDIMGVNKSSNKHSNKKNKQQIKNQESKITLDITDDSEPSTSTNVEPKKDKPKDKKSKKIVEIESDTSDEDPIAPRTKDMTFTVSVTLEEIFNGCKKKIGLRRQKLEPDGSYEEEKKKLSIKIEPGMIDEQTIRFNHMADEKQGYETGDVVVCLDVEDHPVFTRDGNNLIIEKEISLSESFNPVIYVKHLNGKILKITGDPFDVFDDENTLLKKVKGCGMPVIGEPGVYGDLFIKFTCVNKIVMTPEIIEQLKTIFPPLEVKPDVPDEEITDKEFEMVTDTDLEYLEFDSDDSSDYSDDSESFTETDSESD